MRGGLFKGNANTAIAAHVVLQYIFCFMRICLLMGFVWMATAVAGAETKKAVRHWAYQKPVRPALPRTDSNRPPNAIDFCVRHRLETNKR